MKEACNVIHTQKVKGVLTIVIETRMAVGRLIQFLTHRPDLQDMLVSTTEPRQCQPPHRCLQKVRPPCAMVTTVMPLVLCLNHRHQDLLDMLVSTIGPHLCQPPHHCFRKVQPLCMMVTMAVRLVRSLSHRYQELQGMPKITIKFHRFQPLLHCLQEV